VGIGNQSKQIPVICIDLEHGDSGGKKKQLIAELFALAKKSALTKNIDTILFKKAFPVDIRHNSKIFREKLAIWAEKQVN
jgi:hypothetical protein